VHDPEILILDEPTNGLDPSGRADFLALLKEVAAAGIAVLLSTHLLPDVQEVCEDLVVIGAGRVLRAGGVAALKSDLRDARQVRVQGDTAAFTATLERLDRRVRVAVNGETAELRVVLPDGADNGLILAAAARAGVGIRKLVPASRTLETVFLESLREEGDARADS
jgi:ABC-2 type transport system ATP-binding protein